MAYSAEAIRNVALVGHRGTGKTSLHESLLFEAGVLTRLGSVSDGTTASDTEADEQARQMSISMTLSSFEWSGRKINLLDTPGEPSFIADALGALRVCESAIFVINAVMGAEVTTHRLWKVAAERDIARMLFVNMLDRERADFYRTLESLKSAFGPHVVATEIPIGSEQSCNGVIDLVDMRAYRYDGPGRANSTEIEIPEEESARAQEYREKLLDEVAEVSDELMERYLEGADISHEEVRRGVLGARGAVGQRHGRRGLCHLRGGRPDAIRRACAGALGGGASGRSGRVRVCPGRPRPSVPSCRPRHPNRRLRSRRPHRPRRRTLRSPSSRRSPPHPRRRRLPRVPRSLRTRASSGSHRSRPATVSSSTVTSSAMAPSLRSFDAARARSG